VAEAEEDATLFSMHGFPEQDEVGSGDKRQALTLFTAGANLDLDEPRAHVFLTPASAATSLTDGTWTPAPPTT
jgi:hypothetical protein